MRKASSPEGALREGPQNKYLKYKYISIILNYLNYTN